MLSLSPLRSICLERRQPELVSTVLGSEDAEQEAVHTQQDATPEKDGKLLSPCVCDTGNLERERDGRESKDTVHCSNDLRLKTKLVAETSSKVADSTLAIALYIWRLPDVVEHMTTSKEQYSNQAKRRPQVTVLQDRGDVRPRNSKKRECSSSQNCNGANLHPVDGAGDGGLRSISRHLARDPGVDLLSGLGASSEVEADGLSVDFCVGAGCRVEVEEDRRGLKHHLQGIRNYVMVGHFEEFVPTGKCSFRPQSPVFPKLAFHRHSCRLWSSSFLEYPTLVGSHGRVGIRTWVPMQSRVLRRSNPLAPLSIVHSLHHQASMVRRLKVTLRGGP
jgi:hypothetical protein